MCLIPRLLVVFLLLESCFRNGSCTSVPPQSTNVTLGQEATFSCTGESKAIVWTINGSNAEDMGIMPTNELVDGGRRSNITVIGSIENNLVPIQCVLLVTQTQTELLPPAFLTVLGVGPVAGLTLEFPPCIQWHTPQFMSADVMELFYNVSVSGTDLPPLNATTSDTQYCPELAPCQEYNVSVIPFSTSPDYSGSHITITDVAPGDTPHFQGPCLAIIEFEDNNTATCFFTCLVTKPQIACPLQSLHVTTKYQSGAVLNMSSVYFGDKEASVAMNVTGLPAREKFSSNFSIWSQSGDVVDMENTSFSSFSVQNAFFIYLNKTLVNVTCIFAVGASASCCFVIFDNSTFQLSFNGTVQCSLNFSLLCTGFVDVPQQIFQLEDFNTVTFDASVYDADKSGIMFGPAFEQKQALIIKNVREELSDDITTSITVSLTSSPSSSVTGRNSSLIWVVSGVLVWAMVLLFVLMPLTLTIIYCCKRSMRKQIQNSIVALPTGLTTSMGVSMETKESPRAPDTTTDIICLRSAAYNMVSQNPESQGVSDSTSDVACPRSASYEVLSQNPESQRAFDTTSDIACFRSTAYGVLSRNPLMKESQGAPDTTSDIPCFRSAAYEVLSRNPTQKSHGASDSTADIVCVDSVAYEVSSHKPPVYDYVLVNGVKPTSSMGGPHYTELGPRPLDAPPILPELGGKKVSYSNVYQQSDPDVNGIGNMLTSSRPTSGTYY